MQLNGKRYTTIYMSLYGISNLEEISKKIFIETTQLMDKNLRKFMDANGQTTIPEYAKTGIDMANFFGVTQNGDKVDYGEFFSTDDKVLCFDDLERANVDVIDILGYINNFVEHDHIPGYRRRYRRYHRLLRRVKRGGGSAGTCRFAVKIPPPQSVSIYSVIPNSFIPASSIPDIRPRSIISQKVSLAWRIARTELIQLFVQPLSIDHAPQPESAELA